MEPHLPVTALLLPGLHGTGVLFHDFVATRPGHIHTCVITYPSEEHLDYDALTTHVLERLPRAERMVVIGESFSGPVALRMAMQKPPGLVGVVLCGCFLRSPVPKFLRHLPWRLLLRMPIPAAVLRVLLATADNAPDLIPEIRTAIRGISAAVLAARLRCIFSVNVSKEFAQCSVPVLHVRGSRDRVVRKRRADEFARLRPDIEYCEIEAPHLVL